MDIQQFMFTKKMIALPRQYLKIISMLVALAFIQGCVGVNTFPQIRDNERMLFAAYHISLDRT